MPGQLRIAAHRGFDSSFLEFFGEVHDGLAACGSALQKGERVIVEDVASSPIFAGTGARDAMLAAEARAVQSTPLVSRSGKVLGMFSTHYRRRMPAERTRIAVAGPAGAPGGRPHRAQAGRGRPRPALGHRRGLRRCDLHIRFDRHRSLTGTGRPKNSTDIARRRLSDAPLKSSFRRTRSAELHEIVESCGRASGNIIRNLETTRMRRDGVVFPAS